jgi:hypothetical protein
MEILMQAFAIGLKQGGWSGAKHLAFSVTRGYHKSLKASSIERQLDPLCCTEQNVGLQKDDMSNNWVSRKYVCCVGFVVTHRMDRVRNDDIRDRLGVAPIEEKLVQHRLRWFGHIQRRPSEAPMHCGVLSRDINVRRDRGRPKLTWGRQ